MDIMKIMCFVFAVLSWIAIVATVLILLLEISHTLFLRIIKRIEYGYWYHQND